MEKLESINKTEVEKSKDAFGQYIEKGEKEAVNLVEERFDNNPDERNKLDFHNTQHTNDIIRRTKSILFALEKIGFASRRDVEIGVLAAAFHDTTQKWEGNVVQDGLWSKVIRKRFTGENENVSAEEAVAFMKKANQEAGKEIFSLRDIDAVREAISATIPGFNPELKTVIQPNLNERSSVVARALALADIGAAGMDGPEAFCREGDAVFREENLDIMDKLKNINALSDKEKKYFRERMLNWTKFQSNFAKGRKALLETELQGILELARDEVKKLFKEFDRSIETVEKSAEKRQSLSFEELARDMGYKI